MSEKLANKDLDPRAKGVDIITDMVIRLTYKKICSHPELSFTRKCYVAGWVWVHIFIINLICNLGVGFEKIRIFFEILVYRLGEPIRVFGIRLVTWVKVRWVWIKYYTGLDYND